MVTESGKRGTASRLRRRLRSSSGFLREFIHLAGPFWSTEDRCRAWALTAALVVLTLGQVAVPITINLWSASLFDALEQKAMDRFLTLVALMFAIILGNMVITTTHLWIKRLLQLRWRRWLTHRLVNGWMQGGRHFQIGYIAGEHDNPDGRIAEDARITTEAAVDLAHSLFYCLLLLISFTQILWTLSGKLSVEVAGTALDVPGHLVWLALLYAGAGTTVALLLGRPLVRAVDRRQAQEADFRFGLAHARENSEAIALVHGEPNEQRRLVDLFRGVEAAWNLQTMKLANIFLFTSAYSVLSVAFPVLVAAPRYMAGAITLGVLMQTAQAFQQMTSALSWPIDNLARGAEWRASVERVLGLRHAVEQVSEPCVGCDRQIMIEPAEQAVLSFRDLTITNPDGAEVIRDFSADFHPGERVLISGDPGAAVRLFKVAAGLWPWGVGRVALPCQATIFFVPQRPYLPVGTLRAALCYPASNCDDALLLAALRRVGLAHLAARLDETASWEQVLAPGEQQRLGFARLLLHRADWIFIEQATDALDPAGEADMMRLLQDELPGAAVLTIGYHAALDAFHQRKLVLARPPDGKRTTEIPVRKAATTPA